MCAGNRFTFDTNWLFLPCLLSSIFTAATLLKARARATVERLAAAGIACPVVTGGGTGTFPFELEGKV